MFVLVGAGVCFYVGAAALLKLMCILPVLSVVHHTCRGTLAEDGLVTHNRTSKLPVYRTYTIHCMICILVMLEACHGDV